MELYGYEIQREKDIFHYGILGMKWGVRRYQNPDGTLTAAGKKKYYNADGTLNYKGIKKQQEDAINKDPYGKLKKEGGAGRTSEQTSRLSKDRILYGDKGVSRIKNKIAAGQTYTKAKRSESIRLGAKWAALVLAYAMTIDFIFTGGEGTKAVIKSGNSAVKSAVNSGKKAVQNILDDKYLSKHSFEELLKDPSLISILD